MNIRYERRLAAPISKADFFVGWKFKPPDGALQSMIGHAEFVVTAVDVDKNETVGLVTGITDHTLAAYIPFLEVSAAYQNFGIGSHLVEIITKDLAKYYMVDLVCDESLVAFYAKLGFAASRSMSIRNFDARAIIEK